MENGNRESEVAEQNVKVAEENARACWTLITNCMYMEGLNPEEQQELEHIRKDPLDFLKKFLISNLNVLERRGISIPPDVTKGIEKIEFGNNKELQCIEARLFSVLEWRKYE